MMLFFRIVFLLYFLKLSGKSGFWKTAGSHDVDIIIRGELLNYDASRGGVKNL